MKVFMEKWNSDPRFKVKVKLSLYTFFVVFVAIFAVSARNNIPSNELQDQYDNNTNKEENINNTIKIPNEYNYVIDIIINGNNYQYTGTKNNLKEIIRKQVNGITSNYIYENSSYYKEDSENYILTTKDEVYDIVNYNYINLGTINEYLTKSTKRENQYLIYLKDIILGTDSEEYITITLNENKIDVNYTSLMKSFDKTIENYLVKIEIFETE